MKKIKPKWQRTLEFSSEDAEIKKIFQAREVGSIYLMCLMVGYKLGGETNQELKE